MTKHLIGIALSALLTSGSTLADWTLDGDASRMSFMSVKKGEVIEVHHFKKLAGSISDAGNATVEIDLSTVATNVDIRDERMQSMLFNVPSFPAATASASIDTDALATLEDGQRTTQLVSLELDLHGVTGTIESEVYITGSGDNSFTVATTQPVVISADDFNLGAGIEALREIAELPAITHSVPVAFNLMFHGS